MPLKRREVVQTASLMFVGEDADYTAIRRLGYSVSGGIVQNGRTLRPKRTPFTCRPSSREDGSSGYSNRIQ